MTGPVRGTVHGSFKFDVPICRAVVLLVLTLAHNRNLPGGHTNQTRLCAVIGVFTQAGVFVRVLLLRDCTLGIRDASPQ